MKTALMLAAALSVAGCQQDNRAIEKKLDDLIAKVDRLEKAGGRPGAAGPQRPARVEPDRAKTYAVPVDGDPADGPADAKITIVKAYDYACPFCEKVRPTMEELKNKYGKDLRIVYKQFVVHPAQATAGALAFCAAAKQGKADDMDKLLWDKSFKDHKYDSGTCWDSNDGCPIVLGYAQELQLDQGKFKQDMKECVALKDKDQRELQALGVGATPSFFINGRYVAGALPTDAFVTVIDEEMKKADERIGSGTPPAQYYQQWVIDKGLKTVEAPKQ
jgi:protein-disulfide isomerase